MPDIVNPPITDAVTLHAGSGSPYAWRVWLALEHKEVPNQVSMWSFSAGDLKKPEYLALNPRGKVPALRDGDFTLFESAAIMEYLEERFPERPLLPKDLRERALARRLVREADSYVATAMEELVSELFFKPEPERSGTVIANAHAAFVKELGYFEREMRGDYLLDALSIADFTLYPMLALVVRRMDLRYPQLGMAGHLGPKLGAWMKRIEALPYFDKTYPPHWR